jgi:hypothetical protein
MQQWSVSDCVVEEPRIPTVSLPASAGSKSQGQYGSNDECVSQREIVQSTPNPPLSTLPLYIFFISRQAGGESEPQPRHDKAPSSVM